MNLSDPAVQNLLIDLLDARDLTVTRRALVDYFGARGRALIVSGLLDSAGHETTVISSDEDDAPMYKVSFDDHRHALGYHSSASGWVHVAQGSLQRYRINVERVFAVLLGDSLRRPVNGFLDIEPGFVWELGFLRILRTAPVQIWFARRLSDRSIFDKLDAAIDRLPPTNMRVVLTSTPHDRLPSDHSKRAMIISIADVLDPYASFRIDERRLAVRFKGKVVEAPVSPLHLSEDGSTLTILGSEIFFGGALQQMAIRLLVDAHHADKGVNAARTLEAAGFGSSIRTFPQAFRNQWTSLKPYLKSRDKLWRFEL